MVSGLRATLEDAADKAEKLVKSGNPDIKVTLVSAEPYHS